jgi:pyrroloquinoline quinone (PQQ) biosynthesis protein C
MKVMSNVIDRLDDAVNEHLEKTRFFHEPLTRGRAQAIVTQHRQNTRYRNSVLKLVVATNCPDWDTRMRIIHSSSQEVIADHDFGGGKAHWQILEDLGVDIGMSRDEIVNAKPTTTLRICWLAWEALMRNRHWLEGMIGNTCAERVNVPGYGSGEIHDVGFSGWQRRMWRDLFGLKETQLGFWAMHKEADIEHSNLGWQTVGRYAEELGMADAVVEAARLNLAVWERYWNAIGELGDAIEAGTTERLFL